MAQISGRVGVEVVGDVVRLHFFGHDDHARTVIHHLDVTASAARTLRDKLHTISEDEYLEMDARYWAKAQ